MLRTSLILAALGLALLAPRGPAQPPAAAAPAAPLITLLLPAIGDEGLRRELKLSADQAKRLLAFRQKQWDADYTTPTKDLNAAAAAKAAAAEFAAVLTPEQLKRAEQIAAQLAWADDGFAAGAPATNPRVAPLSALRLYPEIGAALKLDDAQRKAAEVVGFRYGAQLYLTPAQTAAAKELLGPPFAGPLTRQYDPRPGGFGWGTPVGGPAPLRYTASADVQKELKLTPEQVAALDELRKKYPTYAGGRGGFNQDVDVNLSAEARQKAGEKLDAETTTALDKILTPEQRARLAQLPRQGVATSALFVEGHFLGKELNITADQRKAVADARKAYDAAVAKAVLSDEPIDQVKAKVAALDQEYDAAVEAVLTPEQQAKRKELVGAEFKGRLTGRGFGPGGFGGGPGTLPPTVAAARERSFGRYTTQLSQLASLPGLQAELKMTEEQVKKARDASQEILAKFRRVTPFDADDEAVNKVFGERSAAVEKALADILDKDQQARLRELFLQQLETRITSPFANSYGAVGYPGVADAIKLTADQKKKLFANERTADVLTDDQKKAVQAMLGKPADLTTVFAVTAGPARNRSALPPGYQLLLNSALWDELKLTPEQVTKLVPPLNEYTTQTATTGPAWGFNPGDAPAAPDAAKVKAAVDGLVAAADATLTADQKTRLGQLALQQRAAASLSLVLGLPSGYLQPFRGSPLDVAKELGITTEQTAKMNTISADAMERANLLGRRSTFGEWADWSEARATLRDRLDAAILKELTPAQQAKWKEMLGEPYKGFTRSPVPFRNTGGPAGGFAPGPFNP